MSEIRIKHWIVGCVFILQLSLSFVEAQTRNPTTKKPIAKPATEQPPKEEVDAEKAASAFEAGQNAHQLGDLVKAATLYEQAIKLDATLWQAEFQLAIAQFALNRIPAARISLTKVIEAISKEPDLKPYLARAQILRGEIALHDGKIEEAEKAFRVVIDLNPQATRAYAGLSEIALRGDNPTEAIRLAQAALDYGDNSSNTLSLMGEALLATGKAKDAVVYFSKALDQEPKRLTLLRARAMAYTQSNDWPKAIQDLNLCLSIENNLTDKLRLAELYTRTQAFAEATVLYQQVLKDEPDNDAALTSLAMLLIDLGKSTEAIASLEALTKTAPERADIRAQLAALYLGSAPDKALEQYSAATKLKPEKLSYQVGIGTALVKLKRFSEAAEVLRRVIAQTPEGDTAYVAHTNLATALFEMDDFGNAAREFIWILNQQKDRQRAAVTLYFLGICFDKLGDLEQAQKIYNQFLTIATAENQLEIDKVKLRLPPLQRQLEKGQGKRKK